MATKDWKKTGKDKWVNKGNGRTMVIHKIDNLYYVRQYNKNSFLIDSLAEGSYKKAKLSAMRYMKKH